MKTFKSHAKINIGLRIINKRPDGYHNLESLLQEISLHDDITIAKHGRDIRLRCNDPAVPLNDDNLCVRAYRLLQEHYGLKDGVEINIVKRIPVGSGLGGGSSNGATCLKAFNEIFRLDLKMNDLLVLASQLGSDVPFFIPGKTALVQGRGEVVTPVPFLNDYRILLVYPNFAVSTAAVFKYFEFGLTENPIDIKFEAVISRVGGLEDLNRYFYNDLESVVCNLYPELAEISRKLSESGAKFVSMSGSGSTVYALFEPGTDLREISKGYFKKNRVFLARPVI